MSIALPPLSRGLRRIPHDETRGEVDVTKEEELEEVDAPPAG
jgi:hypothetical protein